MLNIGSAEVQRERLHLGVLLEWGSFRGGNIGAP